MTELEKAKESALRLIKFRPRSEQELRRRLIQKGFAGPTIETLLLELKGKGFVNDEKFSQYLVTGRLLSRPLGKRALLRELSSKGVGDSLAAQAVERAYAGSDELEMAKTAALSRLPRLQGLKKEALQRRLFGFLSRRGFSSEMIYRVTKELTHPSAGSG